MGLCFSKTSPPPPRPPPPRTLPPPPFSSIWAHLPRDLAGLVLCRLTCSADRLSFGAVCRDWRLAAQQQRSLSGPTPWLNVGLGVYQSLDGKVHRFYCHGTSGCWILRYHDQPNPSPEGGGGRRLSLRNPFHASSTASIDIMFPCRGVSKIVLCSPLSIAAILHIGACILAPFFPTNMSSRPSAQAQEPWWPLIGSFVDIAFFRGKIFAVTNSGELISHDLLSRRRENVMTPSVASGDQLVDNTVVRHLVVSADKEKLMMVQWSIPRQDGNGVLQVGDHRWAMDLQVLEADMAKGRWSQVKDLGGQSMFISKSCSRAFVSSSSKDNPRLPPQGNCVYILGIDWHLKRAMAGLVPCGIPSYCVFHMMTRTVSLVSLGGGHGMESAVSEWFFTCE